MGVCTMLMVTAQDAGDHRYEVLLLICAVMGLFDGCFVTLIGPIAFDLCGAGGANQAIGSLLGLFSIPMTTGPPVAGIIYDKVSSSRWSDPISPKSGLILREPGLPCE